MVTTVTDDVRKAYREHALATIARCNKTLAAPRPDPEILREYEEQERQRRAQEEEARKSRTAPAPAVERTAPVAASARPAAGAPRYLTLSSMEALVEKLASIFKERTANTQDVVDGLRAQLTLAQQRHRETEDRLAAAERRLTDLETRQ